MADRRPNRHIFTGKSNEAIGLCYMKPLDLYISGAPCNTVYRELLLSRFSLATEKPTPANGVWPLCADENGYVKSEWIHINGVLTGKGRSEKLKQPVDPSFYFIKSYTQQVPRHCTQFK